MQILAYRSIYNVISESSHLSKQISCLAKISTIIYPDKSVHQKDKQKQKKIKCFYCSSTFDHNFMLIMHLQIVHSSVVQKYQIKGDVLAIAALDKKNNVSAVNSPLGFINGLVKINVRNNFNNVKGYKLSDQFYFQNYNPATVKHRLDVRTKTIISNILSKFQRSSTKHQQIYFHSTNIFKIVTAQNLEDDSQDQIGQIQRQLQKLRIEDFSDVNDNDKKFFIQWNGFIHERRKKLSIIYAHDMPHLFIEFSGIAERKGIPRINLVMHAWTLWSVGQISAEDVLKGLNQYDDPNKQIKTKPANQGQIIDIEKDN